jgi:hypothetical protein
VTPGSEGVVGVKVCRRNIQGGGYRLFFRCLGCDDAHAVSEGWTWNQDKEKPTFSPSVLVRCNRPGGESVCHSFVADGKIQYLGDCTHALAGQTVELPDWDGYLSMTDHEEG